MGIFRDITKSLKKAAPIIGAGIGMYFGGPMGASIGSGIGSLASGRSTEESLRNAALAGGTAYLATGAGTPGAGMKNFSTSGSPLRTMFQGADTSVVNRSIKSSGGDSFLSKLIPESTIGKIALGTGIAGLAGLAGVDDSYTPKGQRDYPEGEYRGGKLTTVDDDGKLVDFDGGDPEQRKAYYDQLGRNQGRKKEVVTDDDEYGIFTAAEGGVAEMNRIVQDPNDTRNFAEKMTTRQLKINTKAGKEGYNELDLRTIQAELAKRRAPKTSMIAPYMGDPSQLMRNFMVGGEVRGPGTGTSDSVPARLSDGEFVITANAVRGAGGGDRNVGAARMYDMMSQLERVA